jgi:hypothetical protein
MNYLENCFTQIKYYLNTPTEPKYNYYYYKHNNLPIIKNNFLQKPKDEYTNFTNNPVKINKKNPEDMV